MIEIKFSGMCADCRHADLDLEKMYMGDGNVWEVRCEHEEACKAMMDKVKKCDEYEVYG